MDAKAPAQQWLPLAELAIPIEGQPPRSRRIHCNRNLRLDQIEVVGFDMDHTLAVYEQEAMDAISMTATAQKLVAAGYSEQLLNMPPIARFPIRGLLIDRKLGNVLKTDRYRYAKRAYHGTRELEKEERRRVYQGRRIRAGMRRYYAIDTLYELSEVAVFAAAIDLLDTPDAKLDYATLFDAVRKSIDEAHRDGSIKNAIVADPGRFLCRDPELPAMLHKLRSAGKRLFLLTNSDHHYTDAVMRYLLDGGKAEYPSWRAYFDFIITDSQKPRFFTERTAFEEVGSRANAGPVNELVRGRVYRRGSLSELERLADVRGDHVLYVGDHIFGDVLRAKKSTAWRTLMIIREMTDEVEALERHADDIERVRALELRRYALLDAQRDRQTLLKQVQRLLDREDFQGDDRVELEAVRLRLRRSADRARAQLRAVETEHDELETLLERAAHPFWGSPFKAGSELSSFGEQVERYACLYTDRVTNLAHYSAAHYFRGPRHRMAHE